MSNTANATGKDRANTMKNAYDVGIGSTIVIWLNVIILAFFWRNLAAKMAASDSPFLQQLGSAMGATL